MGNFSFTTLLCSIIHVIAWTRDQVYDARRASCEELFHSVLFASGRACEIRSIFFYRNPYSFGQSPRSSLPSSISIIYFWAGHECQPEQWSPWHSWPCEKRGGSNENILASRIGHEHISVVHLTFIPSGWGLINGRSSTERILKQTIHFHSLFYQYKCFSVSEIVWTVNPFFTNVGCALEHVGYRYCLDALYTKWWTKGPESRCTRVSRKDIALWLISAVNVIDNNIIKRENPPNTLRDPSKRETHQQYIIFT